MAKQTYYVKGMHCPSCEMIIEARAREITGVVSAKAFMGTNTLEIDCSGEKPSVDLLNKIFKGNGYEFSERAFGKSPAWGSAVQPVLIAALAIGVFLALPGLGLTTFINIGSGSSLAAFFVFGLIAGLSTCAALVGGLVLSLSKQWTELYGANANFAERSKPYLLFNLGRIVSFAVVGAILGALGAGFKISHTVSSLAVIAVSAVMVVLALQMLGAQWFNRFRVALPGKITGTAANNNGAGGKSSPFIVGAFTFLLPCGFTLATEGMAVLSGRALQGSLTMVSFVLGTMIPLLAIGLSSAKLVASPRTSEKFLKAAGILIIFFVFYNLNMQFGSAGSLNGSRVESRQAVNRSGSQNPIVQTIKTVYTESSDIKPSAFEVKVGKPVRFEVNVLDDGHGCMSSIMVPGLWNGPKLLKKGDTIVMEFTPEKTGVYQITCAMGVPRGTITVVE